LNAVVGVRGKVDDMGHLTSVGITCALCHCSVDTPSRDESAGGWTDGRTPI
jgi:hypothetical protein